MAVGPFAPKLIGTIVSAVVIVYFTYMIYFDWLNAAESGFIRREIWVFLHFPFHLALVLLMEGVTQLVRPSCDTSEGGITNEKNPGL
jgi:predicted phage tail protein